MDQHTTQHHEDTPASGERKTPTISLPYAIITAGIVIALAVFLSKGTPSQPTEVKNVDTTTTPAMPVTVLPSDYVRGDITKAEVVIVEYSDSDCPYCQNFHETMKNVVKKYDTKVAWVYRYFPLSIHANAENEAIALECSAQIGGNDVFWKYLDEVIAITVSPEKSAAVLTSTAVGLGIDQKAFTTCLSNPTVAKKVTDQTTEAQALGAKGTPYSIAVNKTGTQTVISGAYPIEEVSKIVEELLQ